MITNDILLWTLIGLVVGLNLGITGSGGALIALPLFTYFFSLDFKIASFYSLIAVISGAILNWIPAVKKTKFKISILMTVGSLVGSFIASYIKAYLPTFILKIMFAFVCCYSLYNYVKNIKGSATKNSPQFSSPLVHLGSGIFLGHLTTLTGLGGGVVLMPWFIGPLGLPTDEAIPTSLFTILCAAVISFCLQIQLGVNHERLDFLTLGFLILGAALASFITKYWLNKLSAGSLAKLRQTTFFMVILLALSSLFKS